MNLNMNIFNKTKEATEMDKAVESINQAEAQIQQKIFELGQKCYENNKENIDPTSVYYPMVDSINKLYQNREGFYKYKLRLEGKMMCVNCGGIIPYGSAFCNLCGKKADEKQEGESDGAKDTVKCKKCGAAISEGSLFCTSCGEAVEKTVRRQSDFYGIGGKRCFVKIAEPVSVTA